MERVTGEIRNLIDRLDRSMDGECEAPTVNEWCVAADRADLMAGDEVAYALAQQENDMGDWVVPVRCEDCSFAGRLTVGPDGAPGLICLLRQSMAHVTGGRDYCSRGVRRG